MWEDRNTQIAARTILKPLAGACAACRYAGLVACTSVVLALAACSSRDAPVVSSTPAWQLGEHLDALRIASCPAGTAPVRGVSVALDASEVTLSDVDPKKDLPGAAFVAGWHLSSADPAFGGLSGLVVEPDGNLLAVSDEGAFAWIRMTNGAPSALRIAPMRDTSGAVIADKRWRDAEGLDLHDGMAFVSFEREHRVLAFDLAGCGAAARGSSVAQVGSRIAGLPNAMPANGGAEGLALTAEGEVLLAIEAPQSGLPIARLDVRGGARLVALITRRGAPVLTGIDRAGATLYAVLRSYTPLVGNVIEVVALPLPGRESIVPARRILRLEPRHGTDNVEGIALQRREDGSLRLWLVSDDNFSSRQRTLLYAFDLHPHMQGDAA